MAVVKKAALESVKPKSGGSASVSGDGAQDRVVTASRHIDKCWIDEVESMTKRPLSQEWRDYYSGVSDAMKRSPGHPPNVSYFPHSTPGSPLDVWAVLHKPREDIVKLKAAFNIPHSEMVKLQDAGEYREWVLAMLTRKLVEEILSKELLTVVEHDDPIRATRRLHAIVAIVRPDEETNHE